MAALKPHKAPTTQDSLSARPTHASEHEGAEEPVESGLSVDPEDMGMQFLAAAVEQGRTEHFGAHGADAPLNLEDLASERQPVLADALDLEADEQTLRAWERAMLRALAKKPERRLGQSTLQRLQTDWVRAGYEAQDGLPSESFRTRQWDQLDLTVESIKQASLLDHEGRELGEVRPPSVLKTDDTGLHGRPRGRSGYRPARKRRASPSAQSGKTLR